MKTVNVQAKAMEFISSGTKSIDNTSRDSFESVMNQSVQVGESSTKQDRLQKESSTTEVTTYNAQNDKLNATSKSNNNDINTKDVTEVTEESVLQEELTQLVAEIKEQLQELLGLSEEEIDSILEKLNIGLIDLLDVNNLTQFYLSAKQENDMSVLLTNETYANELQELTGKINDMKQSLGQGFDISKVKEMLGALDQNEMVHPDEFTQSEDQVKEINSHMEASQMSESSKIQVVKESDSSQNESSGKQQNQNSEADFEQFVQNLSTGNVNGEVAMNQEQLTARVEQFREIVDQIVNQIKVTIKPEETSMELTLSPDHLGKVNLSITSKGGVMTAQLLTETQLAKEAIESQIHVLKDTLTQQGLKIEAIEVSITNYSFQKDSNTNSSEHEQQQKSKGSKKMIGLEEAILEESISENQNTIYDTIDGVGAQIDISA